MTDNEIIKALECCSERDIDESNEGICCSCSLITDDNCTCTLAKYALDLINRLQAEKSDLEIELKGMRGAANSYKAENKMLQEIVLTDRSEAIKKLKAEAYKECIEKVKEKNRSVGILRQGDLNNLLKELVGDN
jgi:hypothetical protein